MDGKSFGTDNSPPFDFYGDFGDDMPFAPLQRSTMTRSRTEYRSSTEVVSDDAPVFRSVDVDDTFDSEFDAPPMLLQPDFYASKSVGAFPSTFGSSPSKPIPQDGNFKSLAIEPPSSFSSHFGAFNSTQNQKLEASSSSNQFLGSFGAFEPLQPTSPPPVGPRKHQIVPPHDALLEEFTRSADELDALFNESMSSGRILDLSQPLESVGLTTAPSYFEINTSFVTKHDVEDVLKNLETALTAVQADCVKRNDSNYSISGSYYCNEESCDFEIHIYKNRQEDIVRGSLVVEFQRRYGDVMVFAEFYRKMLFELRNPGDAGDATLVLGAADRNGALPPNVKDDGFAPISDLEGEIGESGIKGILSMLGSNFIECKREAAVLVARAAKTTSDRDKSILRQNDCLNLLGQLIATNDRDLVRCAITTIRFLLPGTEKTWRDQIVANLLPTILTTLTTGFCESMYVLKQLVYAVNDLCETHAHELKSNTSWDNEFSRVEDDQQFPLDPNIRSYISNIRSAISVH